MVIKTFGTRVTRCDIGCLVILDQVNPRIAETGKNKVTEMLVTEADKSDIHNLQTWTRLSLLKKQGVLIPDVVNKIQKLMLPACMRIKEGM